MTASNPGAERSSSVPRPTGSMTLAMRAVAGATSRAGAATHLRVGRVRDGCLLGEDTLAPGGELVLEEPGPAIRLAAYRDGRWELALPDDASGRVAVDAGEARDLGSFGSAGRPIALAHGARGRVALRGTVLVFEVVEPPVARGRPGLPPSIRAGVLHQIDARFTAIALASFLLHAATVAGLENTDWPMPPSAAALPSGALEMLVAPLLPEPLDAPVEPGPVEEAEAVAEREPSSEADATPVSSAPSRVARGHAAPEIDPSIVAERATAAVEHLLLGAAGPSGALADVFAGGAILPDAADVLASADGVSIASAREPGLRDRTRGGRIGPAGGLGDLGIAGRAAAMRVEGDAVAETGPVGLVTGGCAGARGPCIEDEFGIGEFDPEILIRAVRRAAPRIARCYEHVLGASPGLEGRVAVSVVVEETGSLSHLEVVENGTGSDELARCVTRTLGGIRVSPAPTGGTVGFRFPFVFAPG